MPPGASAQCPGAPRNGHCQRVEIPLRWTASRVVAVSRVGPESSMPGPTKRKTGTSRKAEAKRPAVDDARARYVPGLLMSLKRLVETPGDSTTRRPTAAPG